MADRDVTVDIIARDKTASATRSAERNFDRLNKKTKKSIHDIIGGDDTKGGILKTLTSVANTVASTATSVVGSVVSSVVGGAIVAALGVALSAAVASAIVSGVALGAGAGLLVVAALALRTNKRVSSQFTHTADVIKKSFTRAASPLVGPFVKAIKSFEGLAKRLEPIFRQMFKSLAPFVGTFTKVFHGIVLEVVTALAASMPSIKAAFAGLATALPTVGKALSGFIRALLANPDIIDNVTRNLVTLVTGPLKILGPMLNGLMVLMSAWNNFSILLNQTSSKLWADLVRYFDSGSGALARLKAAWAPLKVAIADVWNTLKAFAAADTTGEINQKFLDLVASVKRLWGPMRTFFGAVWSEAWAFVKRVWNSEVVPWWNGTAKPWLKREIDGFISAIFKSAVDKAVAWLKSLPGKAVAALASLPGAILNAIGSKMYDVGSSLGRKLLSGITGATSGGVGGAIGGIISRLFSGGVQSWAPAMTFAGGGSFAATSGVGRTGGATPVSVNNTVHVSLDGAPFRSMTATAVHESEKRTEFRSRVGRR